MKKVFVFGNPLVTEDSLPLRILPWLRKRFPKIEFVTADPTELLEYDGNVWILDVAHGIDDVMILDDLAKLGLPKRLSVHDYDVAFDLKLLAKIGKLRQMKIIAVPMGMKAEEALTKVEKVLHASES